MVLSTRIERCECYECFLLSALGLLLPGPLCSLFSSGIRVISFPQTFVHRRLWYTRRNSNSVEWFGSRSVHCPLMMSGAPFKREVVCWSWWNSDARNAVLFWRNDRARRCVLHCSQSGIVCRDRLRIDWQSNTGSYEVLQKATLELYIMWILCLKRSSNISCVEWVLVFLWSWQVPGPLQAWNIGSHLQIDVCIKYHQALILVFTCATCIADLFPPLDWRVYFESNTNDGPVRSTNAVWRCVSLWVRSRLLYVWCGTCAFTNSAMWTLAVHDSVNP